MSAEAERNDQNTGDRISETTPLLQHVVSEENDAEAGAFQPRKITSPTPVPWRQILTLCAVRIVDPIAFSQILPYINDMLRDMHVTEDPARIGFYSGIAESAFSFAVMLAIYPWARLSGELFASFMVRISRGTKTRVALRDARGRVGDLVVYASTEFSLGRNFALYGWPMFGKLCLLFNNNSSAVHSIVGEMTDDTNAAQVFPIYGLSFPLGTTIGAFIGGTFAHAPERWPSIFRGSFFDAYPYAVPSLISACFTFMSLIFGAIYLDETYPNKVKTNPRKANITIAPNLSAPPPSALSLIQIPRIRSLTISGFFLCFLSSSFDIVFALFSFTPIPLGGLGFRPQRIGLAISISGIMGGLLSVLGMPRILRRWSPGIVYWFAMGFWPLAFAILPLLNMIARWKFELTRMMIDELTLTSVPSAERDPLVWTGIVIALAASKIGCMAYGCNMLLVRASAPAPNALGSTIGVVHFSINFARAVSPALASSLFTLSTQHNILQGSLWAWIMMVIGFVGQYTTRSLRE
ncbi:hypothetical protein FRC17_008612 [Serendipita sp. 399]|nr:hypothetical protein FRC17_008612 [Serendipita sp. 399]